MARTGNERGKRIWGGIWLQTDDVAKVDEVLDKRPARYTKGAIVAMLVVKYGPALIARLNKESGRVA